MYTNIKTELSKKDPALAKIINNIPEPKVLSSNNVFYDLVSCIIDQQIHYRGRQQKIRKLQSLLKSQQINPKTIVSNSDLLFSELKISKNKFDTLIRLSVFWETNYMTSKDWSTLDDAEIKTILMSIKGIGNWTSDMILL